MKKTSILRRIVHSKIFTLVVLLFIIVVFFTIFSGGTFLNILNIRNILNSMVVVSMLTIGASLLLISGNIDLSTGAVGTLGGIVMAKMLVLGLPWPIAILIGIGIGLACGLLNAYLVNRLEFQPFIATMAVASVAEGVTYVISGGAQIKIKDPVVLALGGRIANVIPVAIFFAIVAFIVYGIILSCTKFGRSIYIVGGNPRAAKLTGLNPKRITYILYANSGALGGLAGILLAARLTNATVQGTTASQFSGMTAAILGGVAFGGGSGGLGGVFIGLLVLNGFNNGTQMIGIDTYWQTVASGVLLLVALTIDVLRERRAGKSVKLGG